MTGQKAVLSVIGLVFLWVLGWYHETAMEIVSVWWRSESYAHGLLVLPIFGWLVWRERGRLSGLAPEPSGLMVVPVLIAGFGWFLGELGNVASVSHMALVMMLIFSLFGILGKSSGRALVFPILFLMFDVETVFLFAWAVVVQEIGVFGLVSALFFLLILTFGLAYAWRKGALEWK